MKTTPARRPQSFTVNPASPYRIYGTVSPTSPKPLSEQPVNAAANTFTVIPGESAIDREIREAAEREEKWRSEKGERTFCRKMFELPEPLRMLRM